ncbi:MAG: hypothetical protein AAGK04_00945 [Planctomycetota bacterium]
MPRPAFVAATITLIASTALAGPLTPPAGAPSPTNKTLHAVEPRIPLADTGSVIIITQPGSYYLTESVSSSSRGVEIREGNVTLDLNGFAVTGSTGGASGIGILVTSGAFNEPVVIKNGFVSNFAGDGVTSSSTNVQLILDNVQVSICGIGFDLTCPAVATNCAAIGNTSHGFNVPVYATLSNCMSRSNVGNGFEADAGSITGCVAGNNGLNGFLVGQPAPEDAIVLSDCTAAVNSFDGFAGAGPAALQNCMAANNNSDGFTLALNSSLTNCLAIGNSSIGISSGPGSALNNCTALSNSGTGINASTGSTLANCASRTNGAAGFSLGAGSNASHCTATSNTDNGFTLSSDCRVTFCNADQNAAIGIQGTSDTVIDSCSATDNVTGIVAGSGGLLIRSTAAGNTTANFNIGGATYGPVITTGAGAVVTTNPFSNISF